MSESVPPPIPVVPLGRDAYLVGPDTGQGLAFAATSGNTTWVFVAGVALEVPAGDPGATATAQDDTRAALSAPMPARVAHIAVEPGQQVDAGQTLLVLEAMKMELPIAAPRAGVIASIACRVGDLVSPGVPLVDMA